MTGTPNACAHFNCGSTYKKELALRMLNFDCLNHFMNNISKPVLLLEGTFTKSDLKQEKSSFYLTTIISASEVSIFPGLLCEDLKRLCAQAELIFLNSPFSTNIFLNFSRQADITVD